MLATLRATPISESHGMSNMMHKRELTRVPKQITQKIENSTFKNSDPANTNASPININDNPTTNDSL